MTWMDLLAVGFARWFLWACPNQYTDPNFWQTFEDARSVCRAYFRHEDEQLRLLGAMNIHSGEQPEYEP